MGESLGKPTGGLTLAYPVTNNNKLAANWHRKSYSVESQVWSLLYNKQTEFNARLHFPHRTCYKKVFHWHSPGLALGQKKRGVGFNGLFGIRLYSRKNR